MTVAERVLVVGAGPVGLSSALGLARRGIPVVVYEANKDLAMDLRASTIHPPTLEMLDRLGVIDKVLSNGLRSPVWQYRDRKTGPVAVFDLSILADETPYPFRAQCEQFKLTGYLLAALAEYPHAAVHFNHAAIGFSQDDDGVVLTLATGDGEMETTGRYIIGADGGGSVVRKSLGVAFEGYTFPERYLVVSTPFDLASVFPDLSAVNYVSDPDEWLALLRVGGLWRALFPTQLEESDSDLLSDEGIQKRMAKVASIGRPFEITHRTLYTIHQRVAATYRVGRALLAGDAAHLNNPLGGMGMNGGIHDACNLVEKLAAVWEGEDPAMLDRYSRQRRAIAMEDIQHLTVRNREIMRERDVSVRQRNLDELRRTAADPSLAKAFLLKSSMIASIRQAAEIQ